MKKDYDRIKDSYGEQMAKLCRCLFPDLLDKENSLYSLMISKFEPNHSLAYDISYHHIIDSFKNYVYSFYRLKNERVCVDKSVRELFEEAGYDFYECNTNRDILSFKKYYKESESLCTFYENRLATHYVFWAVKKNIDSIRREDFNEPFRDDLYGTSVISLQFTKGQYNTLSIKNRYNHSVENADATFSNDLENIAIGLTKSFEKEYGFKIDVNESIVLNLPGYIKDDNGRYYKFNLNINDIYYCPNNVIVDHGTVVRFDTSRYLLVDYFLIDFKEKKIKLYDRDLCDGFVSTYQNISSIKVIKDDLLKRIIITREGFDDVTIESNINGEIVGLDDTNLVDMNNFFLKYNKSISKLYFPNLRRIGLSCLRNNNDLESLECPNLESIDDYFLNKNTIMSSFCCPNVRKIGNHVMSSNNWLLVLDLPSVIMIGNNFLEQNEVVHYVLMPLLREMGNNCFFSATDIKKVSFPNLISLGSNFMFFNEKSLYEFNAPKLKNIGDNFLNYNTSLRKINCPRLENTGIYFMCSNKLMKNYTFPSLSFINRGFLEQNKFWLSSHKEVRNQHRKSFIKCKKNSFL